MTAFGVMWKRTAVISSLALVSPPAGLAGGIGASGEQPITFLQLSSMADPSGFAMLAAGLVAVMVVRKKAI